MPSDACLKDHLNGKKHKKNAKKSDLEDTSEAAVILRVGSNAGTDVEIVDASDVAGSEEVSNKLKCEACDFKAANEKVMSIHVKGKKHRNRVIEAANRAKKAAAKAVSEGTSASEVSPLDALVAGDAADATPTSEWYCKVCKKDMSSQKVLTKHLKSSKHKKALKRADFAVANSDTVSVNASKSDKQRQREGKRTEARKNEVDAVKASDAFDNEHLRDAWVTFGLHSELIALLNEKGFLAPTDVQLAAIPAAIRDGRDILGAAHTGSGKTLAFGLPVLHSLLQIRDANEALTEEEEFAQRQLHTLIIAPTRELALQVQSLSLSIFFSDNLFSYNLFFYFLLFSYNLSSYVYT